MAVEKCFIQETELITKARGLASSSAGSLTD